MSEPSRPRRFSWPLAFTLIFLIAILAGAFLFVRIESWPIRTARAGTAELERLAGKVRDAFMDIAQMQPRVTINDRVYLEQTTAVAELALVSRRVEVDHEFLHTWAGSTKRVKLHGTYNVKAGFDLRQDLNVRVTENDIAIQLPRATILTVEQQQVDVLEFENGYWNRISAADLQKELGAMPKLARDKAEQANLAAEAESSLREQLQHRLGAERPVTVLFAPAETPKQ